MEKKISEAGRFRINFFNGPRSLHVLAASLFSIGLPDKVGVPFTGKMIVCEEKSVYQSSENKTVHVFVRGVTAEDGSGNIWAFTGRLSDGRQIQGCIKLSDGTGYIQHA